MNRTIEDLLLEGIRKSSLEEAKVQFSARQDENYKNAFDGWIARVLITLGSLWVVICSWLILLVWQGRIGTPELWYQIGSTFWVTLVTLLVTLLVIGITFLVIDESLKRRLKRQPLAEDLEIEFQAILEEKRPDLYKPSTILGLLDSWQREDSQDSMRLIGEIDAAIDQARLHIKNLSEVEQDFPRSTIGEAEPAFDGAVINFNTNNQLVAESLKKHLGTKLDYLGAKRQEAVKNASDFDALIDSVRPQIRYRHKIQLIAEAAKVDQELELKCDEINLVMLDLAAKRDQVRQRIVEMNDEVLGVSRAELEVSQICLDNSTNPVQQVQA